MNDDKPTQPEFMVVGWCMDVGGEEVHRFRPACINEPTCVRLFAQPDEVAYARGG